MELNKYIEHTLLKQDATKEELIKLLDEAREYKFLGVCVNPINVGFSKQYLKDNKIAIFFVYGGPFDYNLKGNYIVCTGFNENGKAKVLYPDDNFGQEWTCTFEQLIEFASKVMLFEM